MKLSRRGIGLLILSGVGISASLVFQNCSQSSQPLSNQATLDAKAAAEEVAATAAVTNAPFAFEASADRLTYMSCPGTNDPTGSSGYVFKVSAENTDLAGVKYSKAFLDYVAEAETPIDEKTNKKGTTLEISELTSDQILKYVNGSTINQSPGLFFSMRQMADARYPLYDANYTINDKTFDEKAPYIFDLLNNVNVTKALLSTASVSTDKFTNYIPGATSTSVSDFTAIWNAYIDRGSFDSAINSQAYMALSYTTLDSSKKETQAVARGPSSESKYIFGRGLRLNLTYPDSQYIYPFVSDRLPHSNSQGRLVLGVDEYDLETGKMVSDSGWKCDEFLTIVALREHELCPEWSMSFMISQLKSLDSTTYSSDAIAYSYLTEILM